MYIGQELPELTPVEIVGCEVCEAGSPLALDDGWFTAYRLEMAKERLYSSKILLEAGSYKDSIGRSYYAMFTAVRALLAVDGQDFSKHAGLLRIFRKSM